MTGRQGIRLTVMVEVYREKVWLVVVGSAFTAEAILEPGETDRLIELLRQAAGEARDDKKEGIR